MDKFHASSKIRWNRTVGYLLNFMDGNDNNMQLNNV